MTARWGTPTWVFFHTLIAKIDESKYMECRDDLLGHIKRLCEVLPCPDCAEHAIAHLSRIHIQSLPTKDSFKHMLLQFHNQVNYRRYQPGFSSDKLVVYDKLNLGYLVKVFVHEFTKPLHNPRFFSDGMARNARVQMVVQWLKVKGLI